MIKGRKTKKGKRSGRKNAKRMTQDQIMNILQREGKERVVVTLNLRTPKPIHSVMKTRQVINSFAIETGIQNGSATQPAALGIASATPTLGAIAFSLQDCDQYAALTAIFDQYKIDRVVIQLRSRNRATFLSGVATANADDPFLYVVVDRDDAGTPTLAGLREYDNMQIAHGEENVEFDIEPSVTPALYASGAFTGYGVSRVGVWLDCASTAIAHYGLKFGITGLNAATTVSWYWDIACWYYLSFRNVR